MDYCEIDEVSSTQLCETFYFSTSASAIATFAGLIFSVPPLIVISVIIRSQQRMSSIYHRILFFISTFDFLKCVSTALTTIPMPKDVIYPYNSMVGGAYGTVSTCEAQAFVYVFTFVGSTLYMCALSVFYLCVIRFQASDEIMRRYAEPAIHLICCVFPIIVSITLLVLGLLNPSPYDLWCSVAVYPWNCSNIDGIECTRGQVASDHFVEAIVLCTGTFMLLCILIVTICFGLIISGLLLKNKSVEGDESPRQVVGSEIEFTSNDTNNIGVEVNSVSTPLSEGNEIENYDDDEDVLEQLRQQDEGERRKILIKQALMYIAAFLTLWGLWIIALFIPTSNVVQGLWLIAFYLQSACNSFIFLYHKVHNLRTIFPHLNVTEALSGIILDPFNIVELQLTGISVVRRDNRIHGFIDEEVKCIEDGVDNASKDMHLSRSRVSEVSYMLDLLDFDIKDLERAGTPRDDNIQDGPDASSDVSSNKFANHNNKQDSS